MWGITVIWSSPPATPTDVTASTADNGIWAMVIAGLGAFAWFVAFP